MTTQTTNVADTLAERGARYGKFTGHAEITQALKDVMSGWMSFSHESVESNGLRRSKWHSLSDDKREALEMIAHKIGRILNGDPNYADSWHDIAGYAKLVEDNLNDR